MSVKLVRDLMRLKVRTCLSDTTVKEAARIMLEEDLEGMVVVVDRSQRVIGMVDRDSVVRAYSRDFESMTVEDVMRRDLSQIPPDIPATTAAQMMLDAGVREFYILHHDGGVNIPSGAISFKEIMRHIGAQSEEDVSDLGIHGGRRELLKSFQERLKHQPEEDSEQ